MSQPFDREAAAALVRGRLREAAAQHARMAESEDVVAAAESALAAGLVVVAMTGDVGGPVAAAADVVVRVASRVAARVQEVQLSVLHAIGELVERACATPEESSATASRSRDGSHG